MQTLSVCITFMGGNFVKYAIVGSDDLKCLTVLVNNYIERGWVPQGGVTIVDTKYLDEKDIGPIKYIQPMIHNGIDCNDPDPTSLFTKFIKKLRQKH